MSMFKGQGQCYIWPCMCDRARQRQSEQQLSQKRVCDQSITPTEISF